MTVKSNNLLRYEPDIHQSFVTCIYLYTKLLTICVSSQTLWRIQCWRRYEERNQNHFDQELKPGKWTIKSDDANKRQRTRAVRSSVNRSNQAAPFSSKVQRKRKINLYTTKCISSVFCCQKFLAENYPSKLTLNSPFAKKSSTTTSHVRVTWRHLSTSYVFCCRRYTTTIIEKLRPLTTHWQIYLRNVPSCRTNVTYKSRHVT